MRKGAIILCGGKSSRMGQDKAMLPFGDECLLQRVVRIIAEVVPAENIVIVAGTDQALPPLAESITIARDQIEFRGPLAGIATGLKALGQCRVDAVFAAACDTPFLVRAFVEQMFETLADHDAAVPVDSMRQYPLTAVYRPTVLAQIEARIAAGKLRAIDLFDDIDACRVPVESLREVDPQLKSLQNVNTEEEYRAALVAAGFALSVSNPREQHE